MFGLFGKITAQPGQRDALMEILVQGTQVLQDVKGCYLYIVNSDPNDPDAIWVTEIWQSQADHQASLANEAVKAVIMQGRPLIAGFGERFEVTPIGGKGLNL